MTVQACAEIVLRGDPDRFASAMTAPVVDREVLFPLYAFNLEIAKAPWLTNEPLIAEMRLQFWRDVLDEVEADADPRAHEVVAPLAAAIRARQIPLAPLRQMIDARRTDIAREPFEAAALLWAYLENTSGALMLAACAGLGLAERDAPRLLGRAQGLANFLLALPELCGRGWRPVAVEDVTPMIDTALSDLRDLKRRNFGAATPAARAAWRAEGVLKRAAKNPSAITEGLLVESEFARRYGLMTRTLRGRW